VVAASLLHCTGAQIGVLVALEFLPPLLLGLHIGALFDLYASKAILIGSDLARGTLLAAPCSRPSLCFTPPAACTLAYCVY
jgi:hypothetical protein